MNIAIVGKVTGEGESKWFGVRADYVAYFSQLGSVSVVAPMSVEVWSHLAGYFDIVVLPGGGDISPTTYDRVPSVATSRGEPFLEYFDLNLLPLAYNHAQLVVGICRGFQSLAVHCGLGEYLVQDLPDHPHSTTWTEEGHKVKIYDRAANRAVWDKSVVSRHHQGIVIPTSDVDAVMEKCELRLLATASKYHQGSTLVEAFEANKILAVQWHPEPVGDETVLRWIRTKLESGWVRS